MTEFTYNLAEEQVQNIIGNACIRDIQKQGIDAEFNVSIEFFPSATGVAAIVTCIPVAGSEVSL